ncbi:MAG: DoxX family protein [bacterium]|nr:DoxX family protein [bacterium]
MFNLFGPFIFFTSYSSLALFFLRLVLGAAFIAHGYPKLFNSENRERFAGWLGSMGFRPGKFWALLVGIVEFFGGIFLVVGIFVQLVAALICINMFVAMWKVKWGKVGFMAQGGWEIDLSYFVIALSLLVMGSGLWSLEAFWF